MPKFNDKLLDELLKDYDYGNPNPDLILGQDGIIQQLRKRILERALKGEMTHHLGYEKSSKDGYNTGNSRNGTSSKKVLTRDGELDIEIPRDRESTFEPLIIKKNQRRFEEFDDKILSMYSRGMTTREIESHLQEIYGVEVSPTLISTVTNEVMPEVNEWRNRSLASTYLIIYLDALVIKVKDENQIKNKALYLIIGITVEGKKEILGLWMTQNEGAKFWLAIISELKNRGVQDIFIASMDGLKGFPEAINAVFPKTQVQLCIVHMIRNSLKFVSYKDYKEVVIDLKKIYTALNEPEARKQLDLFNEKWSKKYPSIARSWIKNWANIAPFLTYPDAIRKIMYTTNMIESVNRCIRKITKNRTIFPHDEAVFKLVYLALRNLEKKWTTTIQNWKTALNQFHILFEDRLKF